MLQEQFTIKCGNVATLGGAAAVLATPEAKAVPQLRSKSPAQIYRWMRGRSGTNTTVPVPRKTTDDLQVRPLLVVEGI